MSIKPTLLRDAIESTNGKLFGITFVKRDGSIRSMTARKGVHKGVKGTEPETTLARKKTLDKQDMVGVYEFVAGQRGQYRTINLNTVTRFRFKKRSMIFLG
ncbi:MAG: hypothetical protein RLY43_2147 [Bacteroidota bacterium]|jgi:hypothetical protein